MLKFKKRKDKYFEIVQLSNRNFSMILGMFAFIGINFPCEKVSRIKYVCGKMLATSFNIFSLYYLTVLCFNGYNLGLKFDCHFVTTTLQFILAMCIRLYFTWNTKNIVENCNILLKNLSGLSHLYEIYCKILIIIAFAISFATFCSMEFCMHIGSKTKESRKFIVFNQPVLQISLIVFAEVLLVLLNLTLFVVPGMVITLLIFVYYELGNLVYGLKTKISKIMASELSHDLSQIKKCAYYISKTSQIVHKVDCVLTLPMFYVLSLFIIEIMVLIAITCKHVSNITPIAFSVYLGFGVSVALIFIVGLASRIPDNFAQLKNIILTSHNIQQKILSGQTEAISYVGLVQLLDDLTETFYVTALSSIKIKKTVILSMLCAFITYGAMIFQMSTSRVSISNETIVK